MTTQPTKKKQQPRRRRKIIIALIILLALLGIIVGPWPADNSSWKESSYYRQTLQNLEKAPVLRENGNFFISFAREEISPEKGQPLMGFSDRKPLASEGVLSPCYARALSLRCAKNGKPITIVALDALLSDDKLTTEIYKKTGLEPGELYFTATHTHSGPGGWLEGTIQEIAYGKYEQKYFDTIATQISKAITESRNTPPQPARLFYARADAGEWVENRIYKQKPANPWINALIFRSPDNQKTLGIFTTYSAHATVVRRETHKSNADYPGFLCEELKKSTGAEFTMFAAGYIGDGRPKEGGEDGAKHLGKVLSDKLVAALANAKELTPEDLASIRLKVQMPPYRLPLGSSWKLFPLITPHLFPDYTYISVLTLGEEITLIGWPGDVAGELADVPSMATPGELPPKIMTSFNGSWRGYVTTSQTYFKRNSYATRMMGFMGPWAGEYFADVTAKILVKIRKK